MSRDWAYERDQRVAFIQSVLKSSGAKGIVFGNSGGKDCCLVGILCRLATPNVTGVIMPCSSSRNFGIDRDHALLMSKQFGVNAVEVDLTQIKNQFTQALSPLSDLNGPARHEYQSAPSDDHPVCSGTKQRLPGGRHRKPQRTIHGILYQMGRWRV